MTPQHAHLTTRPHLGEVRDYYLRPSILAEVFRSTVVRDVTLTSSHGGRADTQRSLTPTDPADLAAIIRSVFAQHEEGLGVYPYADRAEPYPWFTVGCDTVVDEVISRAYTRGTRRPIGWESGVELDYGWRRSFAELYSGLRVFDDHGVHYRLKFSGRTSLHAIFPAEAMPDSLRARPALEEWEAAINRVGRFVADRSRVLHEPWDTMGADYMYSAPYSVHRGTGLVSVPLTRRDCGVFRPWMAATRLVEPLNGWWDVPEDAGANFAALLDAIDRNTVVFDLRPAATPPAKGGYVPGATERALASGDARASTEHAQVGSSSTDPYAAQVAADALAATPEGRTQLLQRVGGPGGSLAEQALWTLAAAPDAMGDAVIGEYAQRLREATDAEQRGAARVLRAVAHSAETHLVALLGHDDARVRAVALTALLELGRGAEAILKATAQGAEPARSVATGALAAIATVFAAEQNPSAPPRAIALASALPANLAADALACHLDCGDGKARYFASRALCVAGPDGVAALISALTHPHASVRRRACESLRDAAPSQARAALRDALVDEDVKVRQNALRALSAIGHPADTLAVASLLTDGSKAVRRTARSEIAAWGRP
ncbi:MAG: HEAT repeat domain-containing protein [Candidatus Poribacteria bacterium]